MAHNIQCFTSSECLDAGTAVVLVVAARSELLLNSIVFAQVHGHIHVDFRWLAPSAKLSDGFDTSAMDSQGLHNLSDPVAMGVQNQSCPIFATPRVPLSPTGLTGQGVLVEFDIPVDTLPSFKGLCATISYYVTITVQSPEHTQAIHFPLLVSGAGCPSSPTGESLAPYTLKQASLVAYSACSVPPELILFNSGTGPSMAAGEGRGSFGGFAASARMGTMTSSEQTRPGRGEIYRIRDKDIVCTLRLEGHCPAEPGGTLRLLLDFTDVVQPCSAVRASLVMSEQRPDGSRVQDKLLASAARATVDAERLSLFLPIRSDLGHGSFQCPLFKLIFALEMEFTLAERANTEVTTIVGQGTAKSTGASRQEALGSRSNGSGYSEMEPARLSFSVPIRVIAGQTADHGLVGGDTVVPRPPLSSPWQHEQQERCGVGAEAASLARSCAHQCMAVRYETLS